MVEMARLDERTFVTGQIGPEDIAGIAESGIRLIVNNRPDGEAPTGQPMARDIEAEAASKGIAFVNLPFTAPTLTADDAAKFAQILKTEGGPILAYCRTGNRSTMVWAAANIAMGMPIETVLESAGQAGYDLRPVAQHLEQLGKLAAEK